MDWQFGYNCRSYLPTIGKCRVLVDLRRTRPDLIEDKWMDAREVLVYLGCGPEDFVSQVDRGQIGVKRLKNGRLRFRVSASWAWDDCPLSHSGGQCLHFQQHDGQKIACLKDLEILTEAHPNMKAVQSDEAISQIEERFSHIQA
jgi:hypothetical protein